MSEIPWSYGACVLCLNECSLTREHVIPAQIGGALWVRFLCQRCNSYLGSAVEAAMREDPSIRLAVENLREQLPGLADAIREGLPFIGTSPGGAVTLQMRVGELRVQGGLQEDGSLILPQDHAREHICAEARRRGYSPKQIEEIMRRFDGLPHNARVELMPGYEVVNWRIDEIRPDCHGPMISEKVLLKISFEFLACHIGESIYSRAEQIENIRSALLSDTAPRIEVERLNSDRYQPIHGLALEDDGHVVVHICLFGRIHYRVHLLQFCTQPPFFAYTCNLSQGTEHCQILMA